MRVLISQLTAFITICASPCCAANLVVSVENVQNSSGEVGCALFFQALASDFPLITMRAISRRAPAIRGRMRCEFTDLPQGTYAVAASHDRNNNRKLDRNFVGMPTEPWAVSNNVRPALRPARFDEAAFTLSQSEAKIVALRLGQ